MIAESPRSPAVVPPDADPPRGAGLVTGDLQVSGDFPPPIACLICDCPAIWVSVYDVHESRFSPNSPPLIYRCCLCDPPPAWSLVAGRWLLVGSAGSAGAAGTDASDRDASGHRWEWFPRRKAQARASTDRDQANANALADISGEAATAPTAAATATAADSGRTADDSRPLAELAGRDGSRFTFYGRYSTSPGPGWSDLIRLWIKHGEHEAWSMLQERTDRLFARMPATMPETAVDQS